MRFPRHRAWAWAAAVFAAVVSLAVAALLPRPGAADTLVPVAAEPGVEDDGADCAVPPEWRAPLRQNIQKFLLKSGSSSGVFRISPAKSGDLSAWRDWQTPDLADGGTSGGGTGGDRGGDGGGNSGGTGGDPGTPGAYCTATYRTVDSWSGGFQGEVTVRDDGSGALDGWTVGMTLASGQSVSSLWNGRNTGTGGAVTVHNTDWNGSVAAGSTTTFGFTATGSSSTAPATLTCGRP